MKTQHSYTISCACLLIGICLTIRYWIGRRRFARRGMAGLQHYESYRKAIVTGGLERLLLFIGNCCGLAGLFLLAVAGIIQHQF